MKTFLPFILCFLLIACKPLDMSSVEGVNFYPYAEDSTQERISLFPLLPEGTKQEYYQYLNFRLKFEGRNLHFSYDKLNDSVLVTETKTFKGRWRKRGWKYLKEYKVLPFFPILGGELLNKIHIKPISQQTLDVRTYQREWTFFMFLYGSWDAGNWHRNFKPKESLPQATVYFDQGRLGLMKGKKILIPAQYHQMSLFKEQLSIVRKDSLWGVINTEGKEVIPVKYSSISKQYYYGEPPFFMVEQHRLWGTMDAKGKQMIPPMYQFLQYEWMYTYPKLLLAQKDNLWGFINLKGEEVLPLKYDYIYKDNYGYTLVKGDKVGLWNNRETEKCFIPAVYTKINKNTYYYENYILVYDGDTILFVDKEGNEYNAVTNEVRAIDAFFGYPQRDSEVKIDGKYYRPNIESKRPPRKE
jgi:hypothetical protein